MFARYLSYLMLFAGLLRHVVKRGPHSLSQCNHCTVRYCLSSIAVIALFTFNQPLAMAQDERDVPFDISGIPNVDDLTLLLKSLGINDGLSEEEFERRVDYAAKYYVFSQVMLAADTYTACQNEVATYCASESKEQVNSCLFRQHDNLGACCASNIRKMVGAGGISKPMTHNGVVIPVGSELYYSSDCALMEASLSEETRIGELNIAADRLQFTGDNSRTTAWIVDGQAYKGIPVANGTEYRTEFHSTGVPTEIRLANDAEYQGMYLEQGSRVSFYESGAVEKLTTVKPYTDDLGRVMTGLVEFYPSGIVKTGTLAEAWDKSRSVLPAESGITFGSKGGFETVQIRHNAELYGVNNTSGHFDTYANGQIKRLYVHQNSGILIDGVAYPEFTTIEFAENGSVLRDNFRNENVTSLHPALDSQKKWDYRELERPMQFGVWVIPENSIVATDENNKLRSAVLANSIKYESIELAASQIKFERKGLGFHGSRLKTPYTKNELTLPAGTEVSVTINGEIDFARVESGAYYSGNRLQPESNVEYDLNTGMIKNLHLAEGAELFGQRFTKTLNLQYNREGELRSIYTREPVNINDLTFDGNWVYFRTDGSVSSGILNVDTRINGILYAGGTELILDEAGNVVHSWRRKTRWPNGIPPEPSAMETASSQLGSAIVVSSREIAIRRPLMGPLSDEKCAEAFGFIRGADNQQDKSAVGFSTGANRQAAYFGCGTTDAEAGILARD